MPGGRPSLYNEEMVKKAKEYLDFELFETYEIEVIVRGKIVKKNATRPNSIPGVAGLARHLKIARDTVYDWGKKYPEFSDILGQLSTMQEEFLLYHGLTKGYDPSFAKFISQNVTRFRDKKEVDVGNKEGKKFQLAYKHD